MSFLHQGKYKGCHNWIEGIKEIVHFWDQQLKQVENLDHYYKEIQEKRETISAKLKDPNFNPGTSTAIFLYGMKPIWVEYMLAHNSSRQRLSHVIIQAFPKSELLFLRNSFNKFLPETISGH